MTPQTKKPARQPKIWSFQNKITGNLAIENYEDTENLFLVYRQQSWVLFAIFSFL
jgi:hypothetical protein